MEDKENYLNSLSKHEQDVWEASAGYKVESPFRDEDGTFNAEKFMKYMCPPIDYTYRNPYFKPTSNEK